MPTRLGSHAGCNDSRQSQRPVPSNLLGRPMVVGNTGSCQLSCSSCERLKKVVPGDAVGLSHVTHRPESLAAVFGTDCSTSSCTSFSRCDANYQFHRRSQQSRQHQRSSRQPVLPIV